MTKLKNNLGGFIVALCEIACGVLLLISPIGFTSAIIIGVGAVILAAGVISVINYFRADPYDAAKKQSLAKGLVGIAAGLFCIFNFNLIIVTFPILSILYGAVMLVVGIVKLQWTVDLIRLKQERWWLCGISAVVTIVFAIIVMCNPFGAAAAVLSFAGISLICGAVLDIIAAIIGGSRSPESSETIEIDADKTK